MSTIRNADRDNQIRELAMTEGVDTLAQMIGVSKERIRQVLFTISQETKDRILALHSFEDYTNEMISEQLQVPLVTVNHIINTKNGVKPNNKVKVSVEKTADPSLPALSITDLGLQVVIPKERLLGVIQQWFTILGLFNHPIQVTDLEEDTQGNLIVSLKM